MVRAVGAEQLLFIQKTRYSRAAGVQASVGRVMDRAVSVDDDDDDDDEDDDEDGEQQQLASQREFVRIFEQQCRLTAPVAVGRRQALPPPQ